MQYRVLINSVTFYLFSTANRKRFIHCVIPVTKRQFSFLYHFFFYSNKNNNWESNEIYNINVMHIKRNSEWSHKKWLFYVKLLQVNGKYNVLVWCQQIINHIRHATIIMNYLLMFSPIYQHLPTNKYFNFYKIFVKFCQNKNLEFMSNYVKRKLWKSFWWEYCCSEIFLFIKFW